MGKGLPGGRRQAGSIDYRPHSRSSETENNHTARARARRSDGIASGDFVRRETVGQHDLKNSVPILEPAVETAPFGLWVS